MAVAIHIRGVLTYAFPLVIDGFIAIGVAALLILRAAPWRSRLYVWALVGLATVTSIWANALHAVRLNQQAHTAGLHLDNVTVGALSAIAPLALAGAVHLDLVIRRHPAPQADEAAATKSHNVPDPGHNTIEPPAPAEDDARSAGAGRKLARCGRTPEHGRGSGRCAAEGTRQHGCARARRNLRRTARRRAHRTVGTRRSRLTPQHRDGHSSRRYRIGKDRLTQIKDRVQAELDESARHAEPGKEPAGVL